MAVVYQHRRLENKQKMIGLFTTVNCPFCNKKVNNE